MVTKYSPILEFQRSLVVLLIMFLGLKYVNILGSFDLKLVQFSLKIKNTILNLKRKK